MKIFKSFKMFLALLLCFSFLTSISFPNFSVTASSGSDNLLDGAVIDGIRFIINDVVYATDAAEIPFEIDERFNIRFDFIFDNLETNHPLSISADTPYFLALPPGFVPDNENYNYRKAAQSSAGNIYAFISVAEHPSNPGNYALKFEFTDHAVQNYDDLLMMSYEFTARLSGAGFNTPGNFNSFSFGGVTINLNARLTANPSSLPRVRKTGLYDTANNKANWEITITNNAAFPVELNTLRIIDTMTVSPAAQNRGGNHTYVADSFSLSIDGTVISSLTGLPSGNAATFTYNFVDNPPSWTTATIKYQSQPNNPIFEMSGNALIAEEPLINRVELQNRANNNSYIDSDSDLVTVQPRWIDKAGLICPNTPGKINWIVSANYNSRSVRMQVNDYLPVMGDGAKHYYDKGSVVIVYANRLSCDTNLSPRNLPCCDCNIVPLSIYRVRYSCTVTLDPLTFNCNSTCPTDNCQSLTPMGMRIDSGDNFISEKIDVHYTSIVDISDSDYRNIGMALNDVEFNYSYIGGTGGWSSRSRRGVGVGMGFSVITKTGAGFNRQNGELTWNISFNQNKANLYNAVITDIIPPGQEFVAIKNLNSSLYTLNDTIPGEIRINFNSPVTDTINFQIVTHVINQNFSDWKQGVVHEYKNTVNLNADRMVNTALESLPQTSSTGINRITPRLLRKEFVSYNPLNYQSTWKITVNEMGALINSAQIVDILPANSHFVSATWRNGTVLNPLPSTTIFNLGNLTATEEIIIITEITNPAVIFAYNPGDTSLDKTINLENTAELHGSNMPVGLNLITDSAEHDVTSELLTKSAKQLYFRPGEEYIEWTVPINLHGTTMNLNTMGIITDQLSPSLVLDIDNIHFYKDAPGTGAKLTITDSNLFLLDGDLNNTSNNPLRFLTYNRAANRFTFNLKNAIDSRADFGVTDTYFLVFGTFVNSTGNISNMVYFDGIGQVAPSSTETIRASTNAGAAAGTLGRINITAQDFATGRVLAGAKFELLNRFDEVIAEGTSNANGLVTFNRIRFGLAYRVRVVGSPTGYWLTEVNFDGSSNADNTFPVSIANVGASPLNCTARFKIMEGEVTVTATVNNYTALTATYGTSANTILPATNHLEGVVFQFAPANGAAVYTITTDSSGIITRQNVSYGTVITQINPAPTGYLRNTSFSETIIFNYTPDDLIEDDENINLTHISTVITRNITFTKRNQFHDISGFTSTPNISNAVFTLRFADGVTDLPTPWTQQTDVAGAVTFAGVMFGDYTIVETSVPTGFIAGNPPEFTQIIQYAVSVGTSSNTGTLQANWVNHIDYRRTVTFDVHDIAATSQKLTTATFNLLAENGVPIGTVAHNGTTHVITSLNINHPIYNIPYINADGLLYGKYTLESVTTPNFYMSVSQAVIVQDNLPNPVPVPMNYFANPLRITATCEDSSGNNVHTVNGEMNIVIEGDTSKGVPFATITATPFVSGAYTVNLPLGTYTITMTVPVDGLGLPYNQNSFTYNIIVREVAGSPGVIEIINQYNNTPITGTTPTISFHNTRKSYNVITAYSNIGGLSSPADQNNILHDASASAVTITPDVASGYEIDTITVNGTEITPPANRRAAFTVSHAALTTVTADVNIIAAFRLQIHVVSTSAGAGGSISPTANTNVTHGDSAPPIIVTPDSGEEILSIMVNGNNITLTDEQKREAFTVTHALLANVTGDVHVDVSFSNQNHSVTITANTVPSSETGGTVSVSNASVVHGENSTITAAANQDFIITAVTVNNTANAAVLSALQTYGLYEFVNIEGSLNITVTFTKQYTITIDTITYNGDSGFTTDNGGTADVSISVVNHGGNSTITTTAEPEYIITQVSGTINNAAALAALMAYNTFEITDITADTDVIITFTRKQYTVTASGIGGTVTPVSQTVWHGLEAATITSLPDTGKIFTGFTENGTVLTTESSWFPGIITSNRVIIAEFEDIYIPTVTTPPPVTTAPPEITTPPEITAPPVTTTPPITTTPPVTTLPPVTTSQPDITVIQPPFVTYLPPVTTTSATRQTDNGNNHISSETTAPPVTTTAPPVTTTVPETTTAPPVTTAVSPAETDSPPITTTTTAASVTAPSAPVTAAATETQPASPVFTVVYSDEVLAEESEEICSDIIAMIKVLTDAGEIEIGMPLTFTVIPSEGYTHYCIVVIVNGTELMLRGSAENGYYYIITALDPDTKIEIKYRTDTIHGSPSSPVSPFDRSDGNPITGVTLTVINAVIAGGVLLVIKKARRKS
jgi:hypothetical protein